MRTTLVILAALAFAARPAAADRNAAKQRAAEADAAAAAGDNTRALALYKQALTLDDAPRYRCNVGIAYYKEQEWARAHLHLALCLAHTSELDADAVAQMGQAYAFVERQLARGGFAEVTISVAPRAARVTVSTFDDEWFPGNRTVWLPHGTHTVFARAEGYVAAEQALEVPATRAISLELEARAEAVAEPVADPDADPVADPDAEPTPEIEVPEISPAPRAAATAPSRTPAWISFGVAGGALLGGAVFHKLAIDEKHEAETYGTGPQFDEHDERFERRRLAAVGLYAVAAVATGVGTYLLTRSPSKEGAAVGVSLTPGGAAVAAGWRF